MSKTQDRVTKAVKRGLNNKDISLDRAARIHRLLLADGPMTSKEIADSLGLTPQQVTGSDGALHHLVADGRAYSRQGAVNSRMYYATEEGEEVPCKCIGLTHKDTCPNWRLPL